ncbi:MAG: nickel-dependent hydrogenase large subunit [Planctomycetes bacterium]|nr:nickel-dependent hydrogenase large subunit [Planctomycetota bacterium]
MTTSTIPIGPFHPLQEEPELFRLHVDGETVVDVDVEIGWNHRGIEKVSEGKTFDQVPFLVERICGICSTSHPIAYVQAVEDAGHIEVPERALYIRSIIAELERLHSHLLWVGLAGHFLGYNTVFMWAWKYREPVLDICEELTGNRNNYAMIKVGGVRRDLDESKFPRVLDRLDELEKKVKMLAGAITDDPVLHARLKGVGILTKEAARDYGALGPTVRGSGIPWDVRADEPYAAYDLVDWDVITAPSCDVYGRAVVRVLECFESIKIIRQCFENMPEGDIDANVTEIPPGEGIGHAEAPRGETFHYVRSDGTNQPVRHKARAPTYMNLPTCYETVVGESVTDATIILASVDPCYSCTERMGVVYDASSGERLLDGKELVRLSQEKTEALRREMGR